VEVVDDGDTAQVEQVLSGAEVAGAAAPPVPDVGEGVLDLDAFAQFLASLRGLVARSSVSSASSGWMETLRPALLTVHRCRSGQAAQVALGNRTVRPAWNGMVTPAGQVRCPAAKSMLNWSLASRPPVLRTRQALQKMARSGPRSRTRSEDR